MFSLNGGDSQKYVACFEDNNHSSNCRWVSSFMHSFLKGKSLDPTVVPPIPSHA